MSLRCFHSPQKISFTLLRHAFSVTVILIFFVRGIGTLRQNSSYTIRICQKIKYFLKKAVRSFFKSKFSKLQQTLHSSMYPNRKPWRINIWIWKIWFQNVTYKQINPVPLPWWGNNNRMQKQKAHNRIKNINIQTPMRKFNELLRCYFIPF